MSEKSSFQSHVGPWPIKRSLSVPDTNTKIFTPNNSPPNLAELLRSIDEEHAEHGVPAPRMPFPSKGKMNWWTYSMQQGTDAKKKTSQVEKERAETGVISWRDPYRFGSKAHGETSSAQLLPDREMFLRAGKVSRRTLLEKKVAVARTIIVCGMSIFIIAPIHFAKLSSSHGVGDSKVSMNVPLVAYQYIMEYVLMMAVGMVASTAWQALDLIDERRSKGKIRGVWAMIVSSLAAGVSLSLWWLFIALPSAGYGRL